MTYAPGQLAALLAIAEHGTFEAAARHLHVTPSAISQRVRALESASGQVLVRRGTPCTPTAAGRVLLRLARQVRLLEDEIRAELAEEREARVDLPVAVNADSLATWFRDVVADVAGWDGTVLRLHVEDQAWSADLLRNGDVLGAVTSDPTAVQGCTVTRLGSLRYWPAATPELVERWRRGRWPDLTRMPVVVFNDKDTLQDQLAQARGQRIGGPRHRVPTSADFVEAVRLGLGWAAVPEPQLAPELEVGRLVRLGARWHADVDLHWQCWRLDSPALARLTQSVRRAAAARLRA
ncbi:LysR family transcriptional regulator ArgP [Nocardioides sp. GCM10027113]|uniref:LysR family transcriptional regulator ArgP n=1 Tax=unclassified Nocardioides TaxID=2615069 RepID=UPI0036165B56